MKFCSFCVCFTTNSKDTAFGNAATFSGTNSNFNTNSVFKCGPIEKSGDSSLSSFSVTNVISLNSTNNAGIGGSSGFCAHSSTPGSTIQFMNVVNASDKFAIECNAKTTTQFCNFIDTTHLYDPSYSAILFQVDNDQMTFKDSIFVQSFPKFSAHNRTFFAEKCFADIAFESMTLTNSIDTLSFTITNNYNIGLLKLPTNCMKRQFLKPF